MIYYLLDEVNNIYYDIDLMCGNLLVPAPPGCKGAGCPEKALLEWQLEQCQKAVSSNRPGSYDSTDIINLINRLNIVPAYDYHTEGSIIYPKCFMKTQ